MCCVVSVVSVSVSVSAIYHELSATQLKLEGKCVSVGVDVSAVVS